MNINKFRLFLCFTVILVFFLVPDSGFSQQNITISDYEFLTAHKDFYGDSIQNILIEINSPLASYQEEVGESSLSASDTIWLSSQHLDFGLNPKILFVNLLLEGKLENNPEEKFTPYVQVMAEVLWEYYTDYLLGSRELSLSNDQKIEIFSGSNAATYALARYFALSMRSEQDLYDLLGKWKTEYQNLFALDPSVEFAEIKSIPDIEPFLRLPFDQPENGFIRINSFFDHSVPGVYDDSILRFDGKTIGTADFSSCIIGVNCYGGHNGIDYKTGAGMAILAPADGIVSYKYYNTDSDAGRVDSGLYIDHDNGYRTAYWHMDPILVEAGDTVVEGQIIGLSGNIGMSSGPHLHFGLRVIDGNKSVDPYGWWSSSASDYWGDSNWMWRSDLIADNFEAQSQLFYIDYWWLDTTRGYGGSSYWTYGMNNAASSTNWGVWGTYIGDPGEYNVYAYWPQDSANTNSAQYEIFHASGSSKVIVDQSATGNQFVFLGKYNFDRGDAAVLLRDLTNDSSKKLYFDAIKWEKSSSSQLTLEAGIYDDTDQNIYYGGAWKTSNPKLAYGGSFHYSQTINQEASLKFSGKQISLIYTVAPYFGNLDIYIDGTYVETLSQYNSVVLNQFKWNSPMLDDKEHSLRLVQSSSALVNIDGFIVHENPVGQTMTVGTYNDSTLEMVYSGIWTTSNPVQAYSQSIHYSKISGQEISMKFDGARFSLIYTSAPYYGKIKIFIDEELQLILNQYSSETIYQQHWSSEILSDGEHTVRIVHDGSSLTNIDGVIISDKPETVIPAGVYDDTSSAITYEGTWLISNPINAYEGSFHYSKISGQETSFYFNGVQISLIFTAASYYGRIDVYIDDIYRGTVEQYNELSLYQKKWNSPVLSDGDHFIRLVHNSSKLVNIDGFIIHDTPVGQIMTSGTYDEKSLDVTFNGIWLTSNPVNAYNQGFHYSRIIGQEAVVDFSGNQISLIYTSAPYCGKVRILIDGIEQGVLDQYSTETKYQQIWDSPILSPGDHTIRIIHNASPLINIDGFIVKDISLQLLEPGTYDDTTEGIFYSGVWKVSNPVFAFGGSFHYSQIPGQDVYMYFNGSKISLIYSSASYCGKVKIYIDEEYQGTLDQYSSTTQYQVVWNSNDLINENHILHLVHDISSLITIDGFIISDEPTNILSTGTYDDTDENIIYSSNWNSVNQYSATNNSHHLSTQIGSSAETNFVGTQISLLFGKDYTRGKMEIWIDGSLVDTINQYSESMSWQNRWDSQRLSLEIHTLKIVHQTGVNVGIDGVIISQFDAGSTYRVQQNNPFYISNFAHLDSGDNWMGVAGQVFDSSGNPVEHVVVIVEGILNNEGIEELSLTSVNQDYGPGGFEIVLADTPIASSDSLTITLYDLDGTSLSTPFYFDTYADAQKNLILINFQAIE